MARVVFETHWLNRTIIASGSALALLAGASGCDSDHGHDHDPLEEALEEACEHLVDGPAEAVTAGADSAGAVDATYPHHRVDIALPGEAPRTGVVTFASDEAAEVAFLWNVDVPITVRDSAGTEIVAEETLLAPTACAAAAKALVYDLEVGTYTVSIGPTDATSVGVVIEEVGGEHDHEE